MRIDVQGRREVETFPRARVQPVGDDVQLTLCIARQVRALGPVLAQQTMGVLVGAALPGAVRIRNDDRDREPLGQALMLSHLFAPIIGQGFPQQGGHVPECFREALTGTPCLRPLHPCQDDQACRPLHQRADRRAITSPLDQVACPVAGHRAGDDLGGTRGDQSLVPAADVPCAPDAAPPTVRCPGLRVATHTAPHRWSRPRGVVPCRQDTRGEGVRQSVRVSSPGLGGS